MVYILIVTLGLSPHNVLIEVSLDGKEEDAVLALLGKPKRYPVIRLVDNLPTPAIPNAPDYVVSPVDFRNAPSLLGPGVRITRFDTVSDIYGRPFKRDRGYMGMECSAPEVATDGLCSLSIDLWSLGCVMFRIRVGAALLVCPLFGFSNPVDSHYFEYVCRVLPRPPGLWSEYDHAFRNGGPGEEYAGAGAGWRRQQLAILRRVIRERLRQPEIPFSFPWRHMVAPPFSSAEIGYLAGLLERLLKYHPDERLAARDALKHPWFRGLDEP